MSAGRAYEDGGFAFYTTDTRGEYTVYSRHTALWATSSVLLGTVRRLPGNGGMFWRAFRNDGTCAGSSFTTRKRAAQALRKQEVAQ